MPSLGWLIGYASTAPWSIPAGLVFGSSVALLFVALSDSKRDAVIHITRESLPDQAVRSLAKTDPVPKPEEALKERIFTQASVDYLTGLYIGHTEIQGDLRAEPHIGKWIRMDITVFSVSAGLGSISISGEADGRPPSQEIWQTPSFRVLARFAPSFKERLIHLRDGDRLRIVGQISSISLTLIQLGECEIDGLPAAIPVSSAIVPAQPSEQSRTASKRTKKRP